MTNETVDKAEETAAAKIAVRFIYETRSRASWAGKSADPAINRTPPPI